MSAGASQSENPKCWVEFYAAARFAYETCPRLESPVNRDRRRANVSTESTHLVRPPPARPALARGARIAARGDPGPVSRAAVRNDASANPGRHRGALLPPLCRTISDSRRPGEGGLAGRAATLAGVGLL